MNNKLTGFLTLVIFTIASFTANPILAASTRPTFSGLNFYYGDLHAHSGYSSDGVGRPEDAYDNAKNNKNDFFSLTEHDEAFISNPYLCLNGINNSLAGTPQFQCAQKENVGLTQKWQNLKNIAQSKNIPDQFVSFYGFEWTHTGGHINVFEAPTFTTPPYTLESFYSFLNNHPDKNVLFAMFNHPFNGSDFRLPVGSTDNNTIFTYRSTIAPYTYMVETNNFATHFPKALKKGYKLGATGYGDGHNAFGAGSRRYGVIASSLDKNSIISAIKNRQTFGVLEGRAGSASFPLAIALKVNNQLMGGSVQFNGSISYQIYVRDDLKDVETIELRYGGYDYSSDYYTIANFTGNGREKTINGNFSNFIFGMPSRAKFVYAVAKQRNAQNTLIETAWSSPVWINYNPSAVIITPTPTAPIGPTSTPTPTKLPTPTPTSPTNTPTPTQTPNMNCQGQYFGKYQCDSRADKSKPGSCQLNPALGAINPSNLNDPINQWKWSYCTTSPTSPTNTPIKTPTPTKLPTPTPIISGPICSGGCYGSVTNCSTNCGTTCTKLSISDTLSQCGWPNSRAYRCCR